MADPVIMPKAGMLMHTGTIIEWLVGEGASVRKGDPLAHIETDKTTMNLEADHEGTLIRILHGAGDVVPVTRPIAWIGIPGEAIPESHPSVSTVPVNLSFTIPLQIRYDSDSDEELLPPVDQAEPLSPKSFRKTGSPFDPMFPRIAAGTAESPETIHARQKQISLDANRSGTRIAATPAARRAATEQGMPLAEVTSSGRYGQIVLSDVLDAAQRRYDCELFRPVIEPGDRFLPLTSIEKAMGRRLRMSAATIPLSACSIDADVTALTNLRASLKKPENHPAGEPVPTINDFLVAALARGIVQERRFNSQFDRDRLIIKGAVNIGIAVDGPHGLVVPVVRNADRLTVAEISAASRLLAAKVRQGSLSPREVEGATITLSNLGSFGITSFVPLINPPQTAILGTGTVRSFFLPDEEGLPRLARLLSLTLSFDHRVGSGAEASRLLSAVKQVLENPRALPGIGPHFGSQIAR